MIDTYFPPMYENSSFHCPHCNVKAQQDWSNTSYYSHGSATPIPELRVSKCVHCKRLTIWYDKTVIIPLVSLAAKPHPNMPDSLINDYQEARSIVNFSPRGAAALLRLALQKLMIELGESGKDINKDIGSLVEKGLSEEVQQALDIVRVIGNESVHPGELDLQDDYDTALSLFELINFIIDDQISRKRKISELFSKLPESKRNGIAIRDK
ncbi:hypothetical protein PMSD_14845 [Paenibacillus macquariensis subsp. defensor]|nr:hypothetical protein PMSD_14845 [Paenibacillus macquariensis subsp. defensor]